MNPAEVRSELHRHVSAGTFDHMSTCRGTLHRLVNEWTDWAEARYETERLYAQHDIEPPTGGPGHSVMFEVMGSVFYQALVTEAPPRVADTRPTMCFDIETQSCTPNPFESL